MSTSPTDRANLAPVDIAPNSGWQRYIRGIFRQSYPSSLNWARGEEFATGLTLTRIPNIDNALNRPTAPQATGGYRGSMSRIPTPQELIKQVTGIGTTNG